MGGGAFLTPRFSSKNWTKKRLTFQLSSVARSRSEEQQQITSRCHESRELFATSTLGTRLFNR